MQGLIGLVEMGWTPYISGITSNCLERSGRCGGEGEGAETTWGLLWDWARPCLSRIGIGVTPILLNEYVCMCMCVHVHGH
jgi:hypothetical protein